MLLGQPTFNLVQGWKENCQNNIKTIILVIISGILMKCMFDRLVVFQGEIRCWSLLLL